MSLQVQVENASQTPFVLGKIAVVQERLFREHTGGKLELLGTTATPDEFSQDLLPFSDIQEKALPTHATQAFTMSHYAYIPVSYIQFEQDVATIVASFHITNVRRDGSGTEHWSSPVKITLERKCKL